jgi:hypothetical protein
LIKSICYTHYLFLWGVTISQGDFAWGKGPYDEPLFTQDL